MRPLASSLASESSLDHQQSVIRKVESEVHGLKKRWNGIILGGIFCSDKTQHLLSTGEEKEEEKEKEEKKGEESEEEEEEEGNRIHLYTLVK